MTHPRLPLRAIAFGPVLATLVASSAIASPESIAATLAQKAQDTSLALEIATDLTTEIGPRLYGSESEKRAANWAVKRFSVYGFDKIWMESCLLYTSPSPRDRG